MFSILVLAAVAKGSVESAVDSMVSVVETHRSSCRGIINKERLEDETLPGMGKTWFTVTNWSGRL